MAERSIKVPATFLPDGVTPVHDGAGTPWYAVQGVLQVNNHPKVAILYAEYTTGILSEKLIVGSIIGAPSIVIRPDGSAYVCGGGRDGVIVTGVSIPDFVPVYSTAAVHGLMEQVTALNLHVALLTKRLEKVEA